MMWWDGGSGWGGWLVMGLMMLIFWSLVIFGGLAVWRAVSRNDRGPEQDGRRSAEQILEERFARGEIDEDELVRRRDTLRTGR